MAEWKRPESVPFPSIWRTFEGKKEINGGKRKYWVQDLSEEYADAFIGYMANGFLKDEVLCISSRCMEDLQSKQECVEMWRDMLKDKLALVCLTKDENGKIQIAGQNCMGRTYKGFHFDINSIKGRAFRNIYIALEHVSKVRDIYTELKIDNYLTAMGLYVLPEYRGEGIGLELLKARRDLCLAVGIPVSATVFTAPNSQHIAAKAGFKDFVEVKYEDLEKENPEVKLPGISEFSKSAKFMYIRYDE